ncbi:MAG: flagellar export protein FliJ [Burkholderiaceae bacterium]
MTDLQPLLALLGQAERERDVCLAQRERAAAAHTAAEAQARQLLDYRSDYQRRWGEQFARTAQIEVVRCYQGFVERLTQAVDQQTRTAAHAAGLLERAGATLLEHELRVASVRKLIERRLREAGLESDRREQKQTDEFAARSAWNAAAAMRSLQVA